MVAGLACISNTSSVFSRVQRCSLVTNNIADEIVAILSDGTYGWKTANCTTPTIAVMQTGAPHGGPGQFMKTGKRALLVRPATYETARIDDKYYENRVWTSQVLIIGDSRYDVEDMYLEMKRVIDLYNQAPWAETATYSAAAVGPSKDVSNDQGTVFMMESEIILAQQFQAVVIA